MYTILLIYSLLYMPTMALTNALAFRQMKDPSQDFGSIRVLGTAGWIVAGLTISAISRFLLPNAEASAAPIRMAAAGSILFGIYALTLPHTPPLRTGHGFKISSIFPPDVFNLFERGRGEVRGSQNDHGADVGTVVHAHAAILFQTVGDQAHADAGHAGMGGALRDVRVWQCRRTVVDAVYRNHPARHLL
jgi:hypothetical protein